MTTYFQDGTHDVISHRSAAAWWVHTQRLPDDYAAASTTSWSTVNWYLCK